MPTSLRMKLAVVLAMGAGSARDEEWGQVRRLLAIAETLLAKCEMVPSRDGGRA